MISWLNQGRPSEKCWSPLGAWTTTTPYTVRQHYFDLEQTELFELRNGSFHIYRQINGRVNWFQQINQVENEISHASHSGSTFKDYLLYQPEHVWRLLGNLQAEDVDAAYWIDFLNDSKVTIATDGSVAENR
eukprot:7764840-Ditylum_brightwellii.AAC.1